MSGLVDTSQPRSRARVWLQRMALVIGMFGFVGVVAWAGLNLSHPPGPKHQVAKIALLPDTPPPPPPPPPDKPKIEPKNEIKQQIDKPKLETPPAPEPLKMAGEAGEGPSPFAAGEVKNEYIGGDTGSGGMYAAYVGRVAQLIQDEITRRKLKVGNAKLFLSLDPDGAVQKMQVEGGSASAEPQLRALFGDLGRLPQPPQGMPLFGVEIMER